MKACLLIAASFAVLSAAQGNWFSDVMTGIQEGIKDSFEETQRHLIQAHLETAEKKEGVREFLDNLNRHINEWKKHYSEKHGLNGSEALNRKAKKLWKKLQKHVLTKILRGNDTSPEHLRKPGKFNKKPKKMRKLLNKATGKKEKKERKNKHKNKSKLYRLPLQKDEVVGAKRLMKAQKIFNKLASMWSQALEERRKELHIPEKEGQGEKESEDPSPETVPSEKTENKEEKSDVAILSNPQEIAKQVMKYAQMINMPKLDIPKEDILKKTSLFFQMRKPKNRETGPHVSKEEEEAIKKVFKSTIVEQHPDIATSEAQAEEIVKEEEKKFEEREKQWEEQVKQEAKDREMKKEFPSMKDIPSKTILPAFIKMERIPGHRDGIDDKDNRERSIPTRANEHVILLPNMREEEGNKGESDKKNKETTVDSVNLEKKGKEGKTGPDGPSNEQLWVKFPEAEKKEPVPFKLPTAPIQKMDGDLPASLEENFDERSKEKIPEDPVVEKPKEEEKEKEEEPTVNPRDLRKLDDEGFRRKLMREEERWAQFKKSLMQKFEKLKQKAQKHALKPFQDLNAQLPGKFGQTARDFSKEVENNRNFEEP